MTKFSRSLVFVFFLASRGLFAQTVIEGTVEDSKSKDPVPFCSVLDKETGMGGVANSDGRFRLSVNSPKDTLIFSSVGYSRLTVIAETVAESRLVFLATRNINLKEVAIHASDDYLYDLVERCRKKIRQSKQHIGKIYFQLETEIRQQPVEMMECYYNSRFSNRAIESMLLKNGRIGLAESADHGYFLSRNTSQAITSFSLTEGNEYFPSSPFHLESGKLKKKYHIERVFDSDPGIMHVKFIPIADHTGLFAGEVWIATKSEAITDIVLRGEKIIQHPFLPMKSCDSLYDVDLNITQSYRNYGDEQLLSFFNFEYSLQYKDSNCQGRSHPSAGTYPIKTSGLLYFYDYGSPFTLPYFNYDPEEDDYRKIIAMPYNEQFWRTNITLPFTDKQKRALEFFQSHGTLFNFSEKFHSRVRENNSIVSRGLFEFNNIFWSDTARLSLAKNRLDSLLNKGNKQGSQPFVSDQYLLKAQIFMDVNGAGDSVLHYSASVFDVYQTFYNIPADEYTDCFMNIYFDLCEIERRKMEDALSCRSFAAWQVDSIYKVASRSFDKQSAIYFKEVRRGQNKNELLKWNQYVYANLGIDNFKIFGLNKR